VQPLAPLKLPAEPSALTKDQKYWHSFTNQVLLPSSNSTPITYVSSNTTSRAAASSLTPASTYITITTGPRLQLLSPQTLKASKTITRTTSPFHSAHVRRDGRICISGSDSGVIQAFDTNSRAILKTWHEHKEPVWVTKWHPTDLTGVMSCSDDRTVRLWDLPSDQSIWTGNGHQDYVRTGTFIGDGKLLATGSYDQSIRVWDPRVGNGVNSRRNATVMNFRLPAPVESVVALPGGTTLVGSSGEKLAVLDLVAGRPLGLFANHQKTITTISTASQGSRVLSGGLDGHVKVWDTASWKVVAGIKYPSPVLSLDVVATGPQREDRHLCVGMQSGVLSIRTRLTGAAKTAKKEKEKEMAALVAGQIEEYDARQKKKKRGRGWEKALRGMDFTGEGADIVIEGNDRRRPKLNRWENAQRRGEYQEALDLVIQSQDLAAVYTMLTEMYHRSALRKALSNRNAEQLLPILNWLNRTIGDPKFIRLKADVAMLILDIYGAQVGKSEAVDAAIEKLLNTTKAACASSQMCWTALGMLDLLASDAVK
jgi:U3 small nucleolar RNA-associated protein 15